jgi:hypothetical protein
VARKDTAATVLGMLSTTGASTRPSSPPTVPALNEPEVPPGAEVDKPPAAVRPAPAGAQPSRRSATRRRAATVPNGSNEAAPREAPRTLRLRTSTAAALREAWLEAKRDDVLLSHQDFASDLLDAALARRRSPRR